MIVWFTGQPGSGKSTLATRIGADFVVDGDDLRRLDNPGYGIRGRRQNVDRAQAIAAYLDDLGYMVAVAVIAPFRFQRENLKARRNVVEVYLHTTEDRGRNEYHVVDYQPPEENYLGIDTGSTTIEDAVGIVHRTMAAATSRP